MRWQVSIPQRMGDGAALFPTRGRELTRSSRALAARVIQVPPALAYGEKGLRIKTSDGTVEYLVPPNERLQFEITLVQASARLDGGTLSAAHAMEESRKNLVSSQPALNCLPVAAPRSCVDNGSSRAASTTVIRIDQSSRTLVSNRV